MIPPKPRIRSQAVLREPNTSPDSNPSGVVDCGSGTTDLDAGGMAADNSGSDLAVAGDSDSLADWLISEFDRICNQLADSEMRAAAWLKRICINTDD